MKKPKQRGEREIQRARDFFKGKWNNDSKKFNNRNFTIVVFRKFRNGQFHFLLQHRSPNIWNGRKDKGADQWGVVSGLASKNDKTPEMSAFRECKEECIPNLTLNDFKNACVQSLPYYGTKKIPNHVYYIIDTDYLVENNVVSEDWDGAPNADTKEIAYNKFPSGHVWISEHELDKILNIKHDTLSMTNFTMEKTGFNPVFKGIRMWDIISDMFRRYRTVMGITKPIILYHGTTEAGRKGILKDGFKIDVNCLEGSGLQEYNGRKSYHHCNCPMMGPGAYFAEYPKARDNTSRVLESERKKSNDNERLMSILLKCEVRLGDCKLATNEKQTIGAKNGYVDYCGCWAEEGYDSATVMGGTITKRSEWVVYDPTRINVIAYKKMFWKNYKLDYTSDWIKVSDSNEDGDKSDDIDEDKNEDSDEDSDDIDEDNNEDGNEDGDEDGDKSDDSHEDNNEDNNEDGNEGDESDESNEKNGEN